jgi:Zn-dependent protease
MEGNMPEQPVNAEGQAQSPPPQAGKPLAPGAFVARGSIESPRGSFRLFRLFGIDVYMNWTWFLVAYYQIWYHPLQYSTSIWKVAEYVTLFGIVLMHEFGHSLACRQVGGVANRIVLWPLGGIAYVSPPPRPGAWLWSIVAGPLVNVILVPITFGLWLFFALAGWTQRWPDLQLFMHMVAWYINLALLIFNILPIYPLDGGQIVRSLLWFIIGPARSLMVVTVIGVIVGGAALVLALWIQDWWLVLLACFAVVRSVTSFQDSRKMLRILNAPRHAGIACPSCGTAPPMGELWVCSRCQKRFDTFVHRAVCPGCGSSFEATPCMTCGQRHSMAAWQASSSQVDPLKPPPNQSSF